MTVLDSSVAPHLDLDLRTKAFLSSFPLITALNKIISEQIETNYQGIFYEGKMKCFVKQVDSFSICKTTLLTLLAGSYDLEKDCHKSTLQSLHLTEDIPTRHLQNALTKTPP